MSAEPQNLEPAIATDAASPYATLPPTAFEQVLEVTRLLAAPFDLATMLATVTAAARHVLHAERCSVWLHDATTDEMVLEIASDMTRVRIPFGHGLVGACARSRERINVPDCYADPRFDRETDRRSGFRTRCILSLPLIGHDGELVGVMQLLNRTDGVFDAADERLAVVLAAQCAMALQRARMTDALIEGEQMRQQLALARLVQTSTLPATMPVLPGYDCFGLSRPAEATGGDTFDLALIDQGLLVVLGDATGHGIAPALSVTQMHGMLRMAFRLGADLETIFVELNNLLGERIADDRFITAFIGVLDPATHVLRYISGGQGPILHRHAADGRVSRHRPDTFPLGAMPMTERCAASTLVFEPGDALLLLSDGLAEAHDAVGDVFGSDRVDALIAAHGDGPMAALGQALLDALQAFVGASPQDDDITLVLVKREAARGQQRAFERRVDALAHLFSFTAEAIPVEHRELAGTIDFVLEELFTNVVKYGAGRAPVLVTIRSIENGVEVTLDEPEAEPFDLADAPDVDIDLPIEQREPGGLGLHLIRKLVDAVTCTYDPQSRHNRITFRKTHLQPSTPLDA